MWSRLGKHVMWLAVFMGNFLFSSSCGFLMTEVECIFRTISIPAFYVSVLKDTIPMLLGLKMRSLNRRETGLSMGQ